jgi:hypothetical protein
MAACLMGNGEKATIPLLSQNRDRKKLGQIALTNAAFIGRQAAAARAQET